MKVIPRLESLSLEGVFNYIEELYKVLSNLSFGDSSTARSENQNLDGVWVSGVSDAVAGTEKAFSHQLGRIPVGFLVMSLDKEGVLYNGTTANTDTTIYIKSSQNSTAFKIFVI